MPRRFIREDVTDNMDLWGAAGIKVDDNSIKLIFNADIADKIAQSGFGSIGGLLNIKTFEDDTACPEIHQELIDGEAAGFVYQGSTIEELADNAGIDPLTLSATLESYNTYCDEAKDPFGKDAAYLLKLEEGPYYLVSLEAGILGTLGGIRINANMQVLNDDYEVIQGLYAVGADAGGLYGDMYVMLEGFSLGWAYNSGRLAGEYAAGHLL